MQGLETCRCRTARAKRCTPPNRRKLSVWERGESVPRDRFGREIDYLRISVVDHCNLRCVYCMPLRGLTFIPSPELLTAGEIETVARSAVSLGFTKFRLTGGEPTLRPD